MRRDYSTAQAVAQIMEAVGWIAVVVGAFAGFAAMAQAGLALGLAVGLVGVVAGVLTVAGAQLLRATVDTATNTAEMLAELRKANAAAVAASSATQTGGAIKRYKGQVIERDPSGCKVGPRVFANVIEAERWIDANPRP